MLITETITITRTNTSVEWPDQNPPANPDDPWPSFTSVNKVISYSDDQLTKTTVRTWTSKEEFIEAMSYVDTRFLGPTFRGYFFNPILKNEITYSKVITTIE